MIKKHSTKPLKVPMFLGHGTDDFVVKYSWHKDSAAFLRSLGGAKVVSKSYKGMQHSACEEEVVDVEEFIQSCLPLENEKSEL